MSVTLSPTLSFLRVPQNVVEYNIAPFLEGEDCLALSLVCKESSKMDNIWSTLAQKWRPKAVAYFRHNHPLTASLDEYFPEKRAITYLVLDYADMLTKLGRKIICRLGVHAELFENFPPEFLEQVLGSADAYFKLPKMKIPTPPSEEFPDRCEPLDELPDLCEQLLDEACDRAQQLVPLDSPDHLAIAANSGGTTLQSSVNLYANTILPSQLIDKDGNRHTVMRRTEVETIFTWLRKRKLVLAVNTCHIPQTITSYRVYSLARSHLFTQTEKADYMPAKMSDYLKRTTGPAEDRTIKGRWFDPSSHFENLSYQKFLNSFTEDEDPSKLLKDRMMFFELQSKTSSLHCSWYLPCVYEPFVTKLKQESKEGKKA